MGARNGKTAEVIEDTPTIQLRRLERKVYEVPITGTSPLIVNRWSEKAVQMMLDSQQSKARTKKDPKDPVANFEASKYLLEDGRDGFPSTAFKAAIVFAARLFEGATQVLLKQTVLVIGEGKNQLVPITYPKGGCTMREDTPRIGSTVDLRYRAQYWPWSATIKVRVVAGQFDQESILSLVDAAGIGGIGEWRPTSPKSATGTFGTFEVNA
jgi:hypothetical protein